jgi:hypothetical protein
VAGVATSAFATSSAQVSSEAAVTDAAEAMTRADAKAGRAESAPGNAEKDGSGSPVIEAECLKEGEPCNVIMDRCCRGLSCQGGLAAICARKN